MTADEIRDYLQNDVPNGDELAKHSKDIAKACARWKVHPRLLIGMFQADSNLGKTMKKLPKSWRRKHHTRNKSSYNYGNMKRNSDNFKPSGTPPIGYMRVGRDPYAVFDSPADSINAFCWLIRTEYFNKGVTTLAKIVGMYAPSGDEENDPDEYLKVVRRYTG